MILFTQMLLYTYLTWSLTFLLRGFHRRWCSKNGNCIIVTSAETALHVLETSLQAVRGDRVRMMRLNEALQPGDDLVIWDRQRVDIEAEKARQHLTEIQQLQGKQIFIG